MFKEGLHELHKSTLVLKTLKKADFVYYDNMSFNTYHFLSTHTTALLNRSSDYSSYIL